MFDRWSWFGGNQNRMFLGGPTGQRASVAQSLAEYQSWLLDGLPDSALVGSQQWNPAVPCALDWTLVNDEGVSEWPNVQQSGGLGASVYWGTTATTPVAVGMATAGVELLGALVIQWSLAGQVFSQIVDASPCGTFVVGCADWVRLYYIGCNATNGEGGPDVFAWFDETESRVRAVVRAAEPSERGNATVTHGMVAFAASGGGAVPCWLGTRALRHRMFVSSEGTGAVGWRYLNSLLLGHSPFVIPTLTTVTSLGLAGRQVMETQEFNLPAGASSVLLRANAGRTAFAWQAHVGGA